MGNVASSSLGNGVADAKAYLASYCWDNGPFCPRCSESNVYALKDGRIRCGGCGYTFHDFTGRWINRVQLPPRYWLKIVDKFAQGSNTKEIAEALMISYNTVFKALHLIRLAVVSQGLDAHKFVDRRNEFVDFCSSHKKVLKNAGEAPCQAPVFGVKQHNGAARLFLLDTCTGHEAMDLAPLKKLWREVVYTDYFQGFDGLIFSCCKSFRENKHIPETDIHLSLDASEGFWAFAKKRLAVYHCMSPENFPLYLKEQEFRYAHRDGGLRQALFRTLCRFVPNLAD